MTCVPKGLDHNSGGGMSGDERAREEENRSTEVYPAAYLGWRLVSKEESQTVGEQEWRAHICVLGRALQG